MIGGISGVRSYGANYAESFYRSRVAEHLQNTQTTQTRRDLLAGQVRTAQKAATPEKPVQPVGAARPVSRDEVSPAELTSRLENDPAAMAGRMRTRYGEVQPDGQFVETSKNGTLSPVQDAKLNTLEGQLSRAEGALARNDLEGAEDTLNNGAPERSNASEAKEPLPSQDGKTASALPGEKKDVPVQGAEKKDTPVDKGADSLTGKADGQTSESAQDALEEGECQTCEERKYQDGSDDMGVSFQTPTNIKPEQAASAVRGHEMEHVYREQAKAEREGRKVVSQTVTMHTEICPECGEAFVSGGTTQTVTKADTDSQAQQEDVAQQQNSERQAAALEDRQNDDGQQRNTEVQKRMTPFSVFA